MNLENISSESRSTGTKSHARWLKGNDQWGYLGIPEYNISDIDARLILCELQGKPHIPIMELVGETDGYVWFKTEYLKSFREVYPAINNPWNGNSRLEDIKTWKTNISNVDEQIESVNSSLQLIVDIVKKHNFHCFQLDIHNDNIRVRKDGTLMLCDVLS